MAGGWTLDKVEQKMPEFRELAQDRGTIDGPF